MEKYKMEYLARLLVEYRDECGPNIHLARKVSAIINCVNHDVGKFPPVAKISVMPDRSAIAAIR